jgi:chromate transporter
MSEEPSSGLARETVSLIELAWTFNHIALASFGGGLSAWSREIIVVEKKWMGEEEFLSAMTMCRILPGANQVNMAVFTGTKMRGMPGAVASVVGLCFLPLAIVLFMAWRPRRPWRSRSRWWSRPARSV